MTCGVLNAAELKKLGLFFAQIIHSVFHRDIHRMSTLEMVKKKERESPVLQSSSI
jgi:hypothetical protein